MDFKAALNWPHIARLQKLIKWLKKSKDISVIIYPYDFSWECKKKKSLTGILWLEITFS